MWNIIWTLFILINQLRCSLHLYLLVFFNIYLFWLCFRGEYGPQRQKLNVFRNFRAETEQQKLLDKYLTWSEGNFLIFFPCTSIWFLTQHLNHRYQPFLVLNNQIVPLCFGRCVVAQQPVQRILLHMNCFCTILNKPCWISWKQYFTICEDRHRKFKCI